MSHSSKNLTKHWVFVLAWLSQCIQGCTWLTRSLRIAESVCMRLRLAYSFAVDGCVLLVSVQIPVWNVYWRLFLRELSRTVVELSAAFPLSCASCKWSQSNDRSFKFKVQWSSKWTWFSKMNSAELFWLLNKQRRSTCLVLRLVLGNRNSRELAMTSRFLNLISLRCRSVDMADTSFWKYFP